MCGVYPGKTINIQHLLSVCVDLGSHAGVVVKGVFDSGQLRAVDKADKGDTQQREKSAQVHIYG